MQEKTLIFQKGGLVLQINQHIKIKEAILLARENGLVGRLEIQHLLRSTNEEVAYSIYSINDKNEIVSAIYPFLNIKL